LPSSSSEVSTPCGDDGGADLFPDTTSPLLAPPAAHAVPSKQRPPAPVKSSAASIANAYADLFRILGLPSVRALAVLLLVAKTPFSAYENLTSLQLLDAGLPKAALASIAALQTPVSMLGSVAAGRLVSVYGARVPYVAGFVLRAATAVTGPVLVRAYRHAATPGVLAAVALTSCVYEVAATSLMFVAAGALFLDVADPRVAGTYLTLLNTLSNLGSAWHKPITLALAGRTIGRVDGYLFLSAALALASVPVGVFACRRLDHLLALPRASWLAPCPDRKDRGPKRPKTTT
jgi:hypothetical protein